MLKLLRSLLSLLNSGFFLLAGAFLVCWAWVGTYEPALVFDITLWAAENSPLQLTVAPLDLANGVMQRESLRATAFAGASLIFLWVIMLLDARVAQRPGDTGIGGEAQIVLQTEHPRAGGPLLGSLQLTELPKQEQVFRVELCCRREYKAFADDREERVETPFFEQRDITAVQTVNGWSAPFRFDIPTSAPATTPVPYGGYTWRLTYYRADAVVAFPAGITLNVGPAPAAELLALEAAETPAQRAAVAAISETRGRGPLLPHERAQARALSPDDVAMVQKSSAMMGKIFLWLAILFFVVPAVVVVVLVAFVAFGILIK